MSVPCQAACSPWADITLLPRKCRDAAEADPEQADRALADATDILFKLSGERWPGFCEDTVRPCGRPSFGNASASALVIDQWGDRTWSGLCSCNTSIGQCGCSRLSEITLGAYPVGEVTEVKVDGVVLDEDTYRLDEFMYLVRLADPDGTNPGWPCCQRLDLDSDSEDTFEVTFVYGNEPDGAGKSAAAMLACQLLTARQGGACDLPPNVTSLSRQNVQMNIQSVVSLLQQGQTGIYEVDLWLRAVNPTNQQRPGGILVPQARSSARRVGT